MVSIFEYVDYKKYLADWFSEKKNLTPSFSYNLFARKAGFLDKGFFHNVIHGKRELTKESLVKVSRAIGHTKSEAEYFENLVFFNKSSDLKDKTFYFEKMNSVRCTEKTVIKTLQLRTDQYEFFSKWYYGAIRSLIDMYPFKDDYQWLSKNIYPNITPKQAKTAIELLEKLDLIQKQEDGFFRLTSKKITTGNEVASLAVSHFHKECADLVKNALETLPGEKRNVTGLTLGISEKTYMTICEELREFREKIIHLVDLDKEADRTYQLTFHLFPVTNTDIKVKEEK
ncbi:MAG TPA: TIGR02147 family protein [Chitinispirillaceae bacterium]|nr:TIGR02147 family protein [Chitinispirillaceae bacterium]